ncbi:hypothetical protein HY627_01665 [Candidatus Uhrbacteria bacterium]|nr:hypothetical protein [Candidatus Uhrbacteria bacterium]
MPKPLILTCPQCSNKLSAEFLGKECPNPRCKHIFNTTPKLARRAFKEGTFSKKEAKKGFGLTDKELEEIGGNDRWGEARYSRADIRAFLMRRKPRQQKIF